MCRTAKNKYAVFLRPGLVEFIKWVKSHFTCAVWSNATPDNVKEGSKIVFGTPGWKNLRFRWSQRKIDGKIIKNLRTFWDDVTIDSQKVFTEKSTILIDDSIHKIVHPSNAILVTTFDNTYPEDNELSRLQTLLQKLLDENPDDSGTIVLSVAGSHLESSGSFGHSNEITLLSPLPKHLHFNALTNLEDPAAPKNEETLSVYMSQHLSYGITFENNALSGPLAELWDRKLVPVAHIYETNPHERAYLLPASWLPAYLPESSGDCVILLKSTKFCRRMLDTKRKRSPQASPPKTGAGKTKSPTSSPVHKKSTKDSTGTPSITPLPNKLRTNDWGKQGYDSRAAVLAKSATGTPLWIGSHPTNDIPSPKAIHLHGHDLIIKILSIGQAQPIQTHPDKKLAGSLHLQIVENIKAFPEFVDLLGAEIVDTFIAQMERKPSFFSDEADDEDAKRMGVKGLFAALMRCTRGDVLSRNGELLSRLSASGDSVEAGSTEDLLLRLGRQYPGDVGIFCVLFLNYVKLAPGEGIFIPANELYSYLCGDILECMAASDNVVRAGLTSDHRDIDTLLDMITYNYGHPDPLIYSPTPDSNITLYNPHIEEFSVARSCMNALEVQTTPAVASQKVILISDGSGKVQYREGGVDKIKVVHQGSAFIVTAESELHFTATTTPFVFFQIEPNFHYAPKTDSTTLHIVIAARGLTTFDIAQGLSMIGHVKTHHLIAVRSKRVIKGDNQTEAYIRFHNSTLANEAATIMIEDKKFAGEDVVSVVNAPPDWREELSG
ncbi:Mannose-6-phosphate isomerase [Rhizophlyctis rosea]|nr:Mannose-6-phosphate isomerase [Rhizophlyctis rosea]